MRLTLDVTRRQNQILRSLIDSQQATYKNWIVTAIETDKIERAKRLTAELRELQELCHIVVPDDMVEHHAEA
jgi:hypothetical protein